MFIEVAAMGNLDVVPLRAPFATPVVTSDISSEYMCCKTG